MALQGSNAYVEDLSCKFDEEKICNGTSEIAQFFSGCNVLITGASGFLGQLLTEKLLRSCPDISKLYMLMRAKKGKSPEERFEHYFDDMLFDRLKKEQPNFLSKIQMIQGDVAEEDLGLSPENREILLTTHVVFHGAATVRFDEKLRNATNINVRGTKALLLFAKEMPNIKAFVYVSTAFSHCVRKKIEEVHYNPPIETDKLLTLLNIMTDENVEKVKQTILGKWPNTYAFTKATAEHAVLQYSTGIPTCLVRPSIIISTYKEPISGWINNVYGPTGVVVGAAIGLLHTLHCTDYKVADIVPGDMVIAHIIAAAWYTGVSNAQRIIDKSETQLSDIERVPIYNFVSSCQKPISWGEFMKFNEVNGADVPSVKVQWHCMIYLNSNYYMNRIFMFIFHTLPAFLVDTGLRITGRKPMLMQVYQKIHKFSAVLSYFSMQQWTFDNRATQNLWTKLNQVDQQMFDFQINNLDWSEYFFYHIRGLRVYMVRDPMDTVAEGRKKNKKLKIAHYTVVTVFGLLLFLLLWGFVCLLGCLWGYWLN